MKIAAVIFALAILAGCGQKPSAPAAQPAAEDKSSVEFSLDTDKGAIGFKKEDGGGDGSVDVKVNTE
jgi:hypothetical protein